MGVFDKSFEPEAPKTKTETKIEPKTELETETKPKPKPFNKNKKLSDQEMRDYLMSQPLEAVMIPLAPGEKPGAQEPVIVNGHRINVPKGQMIRIPKPFADLVFNHYNIGQIETMKAPTIEGDLKKQAVLS
jgi:hypothetical protein